MKVLREGFTTGSCAAAAALASCLFMRDGAYPQCVEITLPDGRRYAPPIIAHTDGICGVRKDAGDDPDITDGLEICAQVTPEDGDGEIQFIAGAGVGMITQPGLKLPVGAAAINPVPREMIARAIRSVFGSRGAQVIISVPGGNAIAPRTFNPRLGIEGGISILGTSGVVRPMSEEALKDSLRVELEMRVRQGWRELLFTFGNQGERALHALYPQLPVVQVSNFLGYMLDSARDLGVKRLVIGGHPGKLAKVSAGVMQTHSSTADARRESIICQLALMDAPRALLEEVYAATTTDRAIACIAAAGYDSVWKLMARAARRYCALRVRSEINIEIAFVDANDQLLATDEEDR